VLYNGRDIQRKKCDVLNQQHKQHIEFYVFCAFVLMFSFECTNRAGMFSVLQENSTSRQAKTLVTDGTGNGHALLRVAAR